MRVAPLAAGFVAAGILSALFVACGKGPTSPGTVRPESTANPQPLRVEIVGPRAVAPGETAQFSMMLRLTDGSSRDVTNETNWQSRTPQVLSVGSNGTVSGLQLGDGSVSGFYRAEGALNALKEVIVVPAGTFRLTGIVNEAEGTPIPVPGARVDVTASGGNSLSTTTGADGQYRLYGVAGDAELRVTKNGYEVNTRQVSVQDHGIQNFELRITSARIDVSGTYTLLLTAADTCRGRLPDEALRRTYTASIVQEGARLEVRLAGGTFVNNRTGRGSSFTGRVEPTILAFTLNLQPYYNYYPYIPDYYPDIVEQLTDGYLVVSGTVTAQASAQRISGPLVGSMAVWPRDPRSAQSPNASCVSSSHQFVLTR